MTMVGERRARAVRDLTLRLADADDRAGLAAHTVGILREFDLDLPFVLLYLRDAQSGHYQLAGHTGVAAPSAFAPARIDAASDGVWGAEVRQLLGAAAGKSGSVQVDGLRAALGALPCGPYEEAPLTGFVTPIRHPGVDAPVALFLTGASARLPLDEPYRSFFDLIAAAFGAALSRVTIAEEERQRLEMLAAIDRAKTVFFSNVSHESRTPLTLMLGPLEEALATPGLAAPLQERLDIANRNAMRLLKLVNSLLDFSRIEAGRIEAQFTEVDLGAYTADLASNFRSACERAGLNLRVDCAGMPGPMRIDRDMWEKIVLNLLSNAFKFTFAGSIHVQLRPTLEGAELRVADTGVGIGSADLPRVFERFHRVEGQVGRSVEGSGIGLSLVRELVHLLGGQIRVRSEAGRGTEFVVTVPSG
ncbi:MAG: sensor histidine kinase [Massilia sp.]|nr:sensor histidine kinase [Massilia sp.]